MKYELIGVIGIAICLLLIGIEYIIHYRLAEKQDKRKSVTENVRHEVTIMTDGILYAPTESSRNEEIRSLAEKIERDSEKYEIAMNTLNKAREERGEEDAAEIDSIIARVNEVVDPVSMYAEMLENGDVYHKGYACRRLADLGAVQYAEKMAEYAKDKDRDLAYNAAMALASFGDVENVSTYLLSIQDDKTYSGRIVNEFFDDFNGDRALLADKLFASCNTYMRANVIKALVPYKIERFHKMYLEGAENEDVGIRISCVKALANFGYEEDEHALQFAAQDKMWVVRAAAIKGLSMLKTRTALDSVKQGLYDKEWWVRQTAAGALTTMDVSPKDLEDILGGYDRYAADAVKNVLYRKIDI